MLPPQTHSTTPLTPASELPCAADDRIDAPTTHADYDLQPLLVRGLEHYVRPAGKEERFFVR